MTHVVDVVEVVEMTAGVEMVVMPPRDVDMVSDEVDASTAGLPLSGGGARIRRRFHG